MQGHDLRVFDGYTVYDMYIYIYCIYKERGSGPSYRLRKAKSWRCCLIFEQRQFLLQLATRATRAFWTSSKKLRTPCLQCNISNQFVTSLFWGSDARAKDQLYIGLSPCPVTVTTRITFWVGNPSEKTFICHWHPGRGGQPKLYIYTPEI